MKLAPLQLNGCNFIEVSIKAHPGAEIGNLNRVDYDVQVRTFQDENNPRMWFVFLDIKIKPDENIAAPYTGEISVMGSFNVAEIWPEARMEQLAYINGASVLYCSAREMISTITSKGFFEPLQIPAWSFFEMYKEFDEKRKAQPELKIAGISPKPSDSPAT